MHMRMAVRSQLTPRRCGRYMDASALPLFAPSSQMLDMVRFLAAYDCFAIIFDATGALDYTSAMAHKRNCLQIAVRSSLEKRKHHLAQYYDEVSVSFALVLSWPPCLCYRCAVVNGKSPHYVRTQALM